VVSEAGFCLWLATRHCQLDPRGGVTRDLAIFSPIGALGYGTEDGVPVGFYICRI
jgi:hypothetical protein